MERPIRWGMLGTGTAARDVASAFELVEHAELLAIGSREERRARTLATRLGVSRAYGGYDRLLSDPDVDVVYVATPNYRHAQDCLQCLQAGKAVLCEKPFALNAAEAEQVFGAARQRGLFCMEAMWMRFIPALVEVRQRIVNGELGELCLLRADLGYRTAFDPDSRYYSRPLGGGCLLDRGVYLISLAHYLMGAPRSVQSCAVIGETGVDVQSSYLLEFENGGIADLSSTLRTNSTNEATVCGTKGRIRIHDPFFRSWRLSMARFGEPRHAAEPVTAMDRARDGVRQLLRRHPELLRLRRSLEGFRRGAGNGKTRTVTYAGNGYQFELAEVTRCLRQGRIESPVMPPGDTLAVMRTMDAIRKPWSLRYPQDPVGF